MKQPSGVADRAQAGSQSKIEARPNNTLQPTGPAVVGLMEYEVSQASPVAELRRSASGVPHLR
jgi:hypothetical protein